MEEQVREHGPQVVGQAVEMELTSHLKADDTRYPVEVLTAFDFDAIPGANGHIEVLTNASEATAHATSLTKNTSQGHRRTLGVVG